MDSLLNEGTPANAPHGPIPEAVAALTPAGNAFAPPPTKGGQSRGEEDGTGLDRVLFLAYALALWTELCLVGRGGQAQGSFPGEVRGG